MKITRQLRLDRLAADGTAQIQLTIWWEGNRLRLGTGAAVLPEHWDGQQVKVGKGTPHASLNPRLNRATEAAAEAQALAAKQGQRLPKEELKAAVDAALALTPVAAQAPATAPAAAATDFESLQRRWILEQVNRPRRGTGKPLAKTTQAGFAATLERFLEYQKSRGIVLRVEALDLAFYQDFRTYMLEELGQGVNTFGKHIRRLKTFLTWVETEADLPVHRHVRKFVVPAQRGKVEALTEKELQQVAGLDFTSEPVRQQLTALRLELGRPTGQASCYHSRQYGRALGLGNGFGTQQRVF